jgi:hypothetical protein
MECEVMEPGVAPGPGCGVTGGPVGGSEGRAPTNASGPSPPAGEAAIFDNLEKEMMATIRKYKDEIRKTYKDVDDPQAIDGTIDMIIAAVIRELEDVGYYFDTAAVDNVLYHLNRTIKSEEWEVVER